MKLLKFTLEQGATDIQKRNITAMERQRKTLTNKVEEVHDIKVRVQELRIEKGDSLDEIQEWNAKLEDSVTWYEKAVADLDKSISEIKSDESQAAKQKEEETTAEIREQKFQEELRFEKAKLEQSLKYKAKLKEDQKGQSSTNAKLPKLVITKFKGTYTDWLRFWGQYEAEIEAANIPKLTKFSYLKELLEPKVRSIINGLPFTIEGYERAKNILKTKYGKNSEIINAYVNNIMVLPVVQGANPNKIYEFYETLLSSVQSLETMGKLGEVNGYVRMTLDKLEGIKGDLVRTEDSWQEWKFPHLIEALRKWTERNPPRREERFDKFQTPKPGKTRSFQTREKELTPRPCVYCESSGHKSVQCDKIIATSERKKQLALKKLCFNCTGANHRASECYCSTTCQLCHKKHHTSICDKKPEQMMVANGKGSVTYPVVVVEIGGIKCRALLDTGAGSSYASAALLDRMGKQPARKEFRRIEMMMQTTNKEIEIYEVAIKNLSGDFQLETEVTKVNRGVLLTLANPQYNDLIKQFDHLKGVTMDDTDAKKELPVHLILGTSEYARIKTRTTPKIGNPGEPIAEQTQLGWTIMSSGKEPDLTQMLMTQTTASDYDNLCRLDVLGLQDHPVDDQECVYQEFKEQLVRNQDGSYETGLLWKGNHPPLASNKNGSLKRLDNLVKKLDRQPNMLENYDAIIKDQLSQGIVERVQEKPKGNEFYIPHKAVVRETATSTKIRIVYDASARPNEESPSLNECLETGPQLQNQLWSVLVRSRFHPVALAGDLKQAFLQVRVREQDRDAMRFHWLKDLTSREVETLRFTRALFGLSISPFLLGGVIKQHLQNMEPTYPEQVEEIRRSLYVDDLITGGETVTETQLLKESCETIFGEAKFKLHKWHSNIPMLEVETMPPEETGPSYAKEQLGVKTGETKLLGVAWNKAKDTIGVNFPKPLTEITKREVLGKIARIYDPLGLASPITLAGKLLYREACDTRNPWDKELPRELMASWKSWERTLPERVEVPRSLVKYQEEINAIDLHAFGDASSKGVSTAVYAITYQPSGSNQGLVATKSRLAKKGLTIPRLELVAGHMSTNLLHNVKESLQGFPIRNVYSWLDSTVALHWIRGQGVYKQFVNHRVRKIQDKAYIQWRYVSSTKNPADLGSRGGQVDESSKLWLNGPPWLAKEDEWPADIVTSSTKETQAEARLIKDVLAVAVEAEDELDDLMKKWEFWKALRITAWIARFRRNCTTKCEERLVGPLTTQELNAQIEFWVKRVQSRCQDLETFNDQKLQLNLQMNERGILECRGRVQGDYPIFLPDGDMFTEKLVTHAHVETLHGGVGLTMTKVRQTYWIPRLRRLTRRVIKRCHGCKRFQVSAFNNPPTGNLPQERTTGSTPFKVIGVDYAGPIRYLGKMKKEKKAYILLYTCSLTRAVYLDLLPNQSKEECIHSLKRFIARRGRPEKIFSDNGATFVAAAKWLKKIRNDEQFNDWLAKQKINWQFNLSRAPWWGGQFERLVGLTKQALYKSIGKGNLRWQELEEVLLDVETTLNNRPLSYVEDDVQMPILTPSAMLFGQPNQIPEEDVDAVEDVDLRKRARYLRRCKDGLWSRWTSEYLKALRERHNLKHKTKKLTVKPGDVVLIKGDERNRAKWKIGIVDHLIKGRDGIVRGVRLRAGKSYLERPIQHLYPLELSCDRSQPQEDTTLDVHAAEFRPRAAATIARQRIAEIAQNELQED